MELKKKECYHKNVQKITRTAGTWLIVSPSLGFSTLFFES